MAAPALDWWKFMIWTYEWKPCIENEHSWLTIVRPCPSPSSLK
jgi:hypothetical protein